MYEIVVNQLKDIIRELKFPPLSGEPTKEDIIGTLEMTLDFILSEEVDLDGYAEALERIDELETGVSDAISELDDLVDDMEDVYEDKFDEILAKAKHIKYDLQIL